MSSMYCNVKGNVLKNTKEKKLVTNSTDTSKRNSRTEINGSYLSLRSLIYQGLVSIFKSRLQIPWLLLYQWNCTYKAVANIPCRKITKSNISGGGTVDCNNRDKNFFFILPLGNVFPSLHEYGPWTICRLSMGLANFSSYPVRLHISTGPDRASRRDM